MVGDVELELVSEGPNHRFGGIGNVLISVYWGAPDAAALEDRVPWVERMRAEYGQGGLLVWVCADASGSLPDAAFRQTSRAQSERYEGTIVFSASVIEGETCSTAWSAPSCAASRSSRRAASRPRSSTTRPARSPGWRPAPSLTAARMSPRFRTRWKHCAEGD